MTAEAQPNRRWLMIGAMAAVGAIVGFFLARTTIGLVENATLAWADIVALFLAVTLTAQGAFVLLLSLNRRAAGAIFGGPGAKPASDGQISFYRQQGGVVLLAGVMLAAPVALTLFGGSAPSREMAMGVMAGIVVAFVLQTILNVIVWRRADEFMRRLIAETSSVCFWVLQAALFLWASGERLALLPALDAWSAVAIMMSVYLCASAFISTRNGVGA